MILATNFSQDDIMLLTIQQLKNFFPISEENHLLISLCVPNVLRRIDKCFNATQNKYYHKDDDVFFNPFHSGQYCIYLYYLSNEVWKYGDSILADKVYYLNKIMNGCDLFYEVELPEVFMLDHPVGSVMGRAIYGERFTFGQNCTVGNNKGIYPKIGCNVKLSTHSSIIGNCHIGDNVTIGAYACVKDQDIPDNSIVFGQSPNLIIKSKNE